MVKDLSRNLIWCQFQIVYFCVHTAKPDIITRQVYSHNFE